MIWHTLIEKTLNIKKSVGPHLVPITVGGSDSEIYAFDTAGKDYIARVFSKDRDKMDKENEVFFLKMASDNSITPPLFYASAADDLVLQERIHTLPHNFFEKSRLTMLFHCVKKLHTIPLSQKAPPHDNHYWTWAFDAAKNIHDKKYENFLKTTRYQRILAAMKKHRTTTVTHNDLNPRNILWDGKRLYLIDFENASMGDPYFDLATLMLFYIFSEQDTQLLFTNYLDCPPTIIEHAKLHLMTIVCITTYGLWYLGFLYEGHQDHQNKSLHDILTRIAQGDDYLSTPDDYVELGLRLFDKATALLHNETTQKALLVLEQ